MSASDNLSPALFHGTSHVFEPGQQVLPRANTGLRPNFPAKRGIDGRSDRHWVSASGLEDKAWFYAHRSAEKTGERSRVTEVAPNADTQVGRYHPDHPGFAKREGSPREDWREYVSPTFEAKGTMDIKPGHQGTFPQVNWNEHSRLDHVPFDDAFNHPTHEDVEHGTPGSSIHVERLRQVFGDPYAPKPAGPDPRQMLLG